MVSVTLLLLLALSTAAATAVVDNQYRDYLLSLPQGDGAVAMSDQKERVFAGVTLGYVTPWNYAGFASVSPRFAHKFTHLSPVWLQLRDTGVHGQENVDARWTAKMQAAGVKVVPRVILELSRSRVESLVRSKQFQTELAASVAAVCAKHSFNGVVLEMTSLYAGIPTSYTLRLNRFVKRVAKQLHQASRELVLVIGPNFRHENFVALYKHVDYWSLMTYDYYNHVGKQAPNAPLPWVRHTLDTLLGDLKGHVGVTRRILMGLNFYGMQWAQSKPPKAVIGHEFVALLSEPGELRWDAKQAEHSFHSKGFAGDGTYQASITYFPTPQSIERRVELAKQVGVGLSVWEIGQGLSAFFDQL